MKHYILSSSYSYKTKGFTLIELLVVIAIIGILSSVVISSLNKARVKANDSRRLADVKQLKTALNLYANDNNGNYPNPSGAVCIGAASGTQCWTGYVLNSGGYGINASPSFDALLSPYIKTTVDPKPNRSVGDRYVYFQGSATIHCNGIDDKTGSWIAWEPESVSPASDAQCGSGQFACCSQIGCGSHYFCVEKVD